MFSVTRSPYFASESLTEALIEARDRSMSMRAGTGGTCSVLDAYGCTLARFVNGAPFLDIGSTVAERRMVSAAMLEAFSEQP